MIVSSDTAGCNELSSLAIIPVLLQLVAGSCILLVISWFGITLSVLPSSLCATRYLLLLLKLGVMLGLGCSGNMRVYSAAALNRNEVFPGKLSDDVLEKSRYLESALKK